MHKTICDGCGREMGAEFVGRVTHIDSYGDTANDYAIDFCSLPCLVRARLGVCGWVPDLEELRDQLNAVLDEMIAGRKK